MLDTGSGFTNIDQSQMLALNLKYGASPYVASAIGNQPRHVGTTAVMNLRIGDCLVRNATAGVWDFSDLNKNFEQQGLPRIQGLLGCELLWTYGAIIDCGNRRLFFTSGDGL